MKIFIPFKISKLAFTFLLIGTLQFGFGQIVWDGGGDQTSWNDAMNWNPDMVPPADSLVLFNMDAMVSGTASAAPVRLTISGGSSVTLDLDLSLGNGTAEEHSIVINAKSTLTLGGSNSPTFNLNPPANKQGVAAFNSADSITLNIAEGTTLNILQGTNGINIANSIGWLNNEGTLNCESGVKNGIKTNVDVTNNGTINLDQLITDGIVMNNGFFENNGSITITKPGEDCIEILDAAMFTNHGTLDLIAKDSAGSGNNAIAIGTDMLGGSFVNAKEGVVNADGGDKDSGRAISVNEMGTFSNAGIITTTGGGEGSRLYNRGTSTNELNGIIDLTDGRAIEDVKIKVTNICDAAIMTTSIFSPEKETIQLLVFPSLVTYQNEVNIDLSQVPVDNIQWSVFNMNGQRVGQYRSDGIQVFTLPVEHYENGMYIIKAETEAFNFIGKMSIAK